ncbi:helix-turn-helix domain-containing protein [Myxococcus xanthus]|uniref:helix-turn-helix domain-containing protein n=1 Tax=Myxococcus xanthus TaxID=34 RepID=UPI003AB21948
MRNVQRFLVRYRAGGLDGLKIQWAPGRTPLIPEALAPLILDWVRKGPRACGLKRANWTHAALADFLYQRTGIRVRETAMGDFCRRRGVRPYRPHLPLPAGRCCTPAEGARGVEGKKRQAQRGVIVLLSRDEGRFPMVPTLTATLGLKGERPVVVPATARTWCTRLPPSTSSPVR